MDKIISLQNHCPLRFIVGIDPGKTGGIVGLHKDTGNLAWLEPMPITADQFNPTEFLLSLKRREIIDHIFLEHAQAFRGQGLSSTFNYGRDFGIIIGLLTAAKYPYTLLKPGHWQKKMFIGTQTSLHPKKKAWAVAARIFPEVNFLKSERSKKPHEGMIDAALIAEFGRRMFRE